MVCVLYRWERKRAGEQLGHRRRADVEYTRSRARRLTAVLATSERCSGGPVAHRAHRRALTGSGSLLGRFVHMPRQELARETSELIRASPRIEKALFGTNARD